MKPKSKTVNILAFATGLLLFVPAVAAPACTGEGRGGFGSAPPPASTVAVSPTPTSPPPPTPRRKIVIRTPGLPFDPDEVVIGAGELVTIVLDNTDSQAHTLTVNEFTLLIRAEPGERVRLPLSVETPGTFQMYCSIPGHRAAGMQGTIVVS